MLPGNAPTPLDLRFKFAGYPVRVSPWFWLVMAVLGGSMLGDAELGAVALVVWVAAGFVSILVHELGHAVTAWQFRAPAAISLVAFGGYAEYYDRPPPSGWRRLLVCLMGPIAGFLLAGLVFVSHLSTGWMALHPVLGYFGYFVMLQSIVWGVLNLLPVYPLDGGQAMREVFTIFGLRRPVPAMHSLSAVAAGVMVLFSLAQIVSPGHPAVSWFPFAGGPIWIVYFALMGVMNWQELQKHNAMRSWEFEDRDPWR